MITKVMPNSVKMKNILLAYDEKEYLIPAYAVAHAYAAKAASQVCASQEDVYYSHFFLCYQNDRMLLSALDKTASDLDWIVENARMYSTDIPLLHEDLHKNWNFVKKSVVRQEVYPFVEAAKHRQRFVESSEVSE